MDVYRSGRCVHTPPRAIVNAKYALVLLALRHTPETGCARAVSLRRKLARVPRPIKAYALGLSVLGAARAEISLFFFFHPCADRESSEGL
uniref:Uncharacterized protein n=1 Tax=Trichogramma kaykai TaxID=54128 RepID=A0ABD2X3I8_9HYME